MLPLLLSTLVLTPAVAASTNDAKKDQLGPPGTIALEGGRTQIGIDKKDLQRLVNEIPGAATHLRSLDAETPEWTLDVSPFFIGVTEVTNEQFAAFVRATGHRPPEEWGKAALDAAQNAFLEQRGKENRELQAQGKPLLDRTFDRAKWWSENWPSQEWSIPKGAELRPVTFVSYADVSAYCRWAGVRPMTEFEFQHAVRGRASNRPYPWGEEWVDGKYCATSEDRRFTETRPAGTYEDGRSPEGVYELLGNAWEWTSSPYIAYPDFEKGTYKVEGKKEAQPEPAWDGNNKVVVGGSVQNTRVAARGTVRRSTDRGMMNSALGFRIAGAVRPGADIGEAVFADDVRNSSYRPTGIDYLPDQPATMDLWSHEGGSEGAPDGYAVITGYEYLVFCPVAELPVTEDPEWRRMTLGEPQHVGYLSMTFDLVEPALPAGTYLVAFRASGATSVLVDEAGAGSTEPDPKGEPQTKEASRREDPWAAVLDISKDHLLFTDVKTGELVAHVPVEGITFGKGRNGGAVERFDKMIPMPDPKDEKKTIQVPEPWMRVSYRVRCKIDDRGLALPIEFKPTPDVLEKAWRM